MSRIWSELVSDLQSKGADEVEDSSPEALGGSKIAFREVINVYVGITRSIDGAFEIWHDYIRVPQWQRRAKVYILLRIPDVYCRSFLTVVHWHDVEPLATEWIQKPKMVAPSFRLNAITHVCNCSSACGRLWNTFGVKEFALCQGVRVMRRWRDIFSRPTDRL